MKRFARASALALILLGLVARPAQADDPPPVNKAAWTVMVYLDADNDLEAPMIKNLEDMLKVGSTDKVNIIALVARSPLGEPDPRYTNRAVANLPNWTSGKLLRIERGALRQIADWGAVDMGDGATLTRFLQTATQGFPADRYALILGDHGMAWAGAAVADSAGSDSLSLQEIGDALQEVTKDVGPLELIGFDACLMANLEVAKTVAPYARYLVASEEIEPADGWNYVALFTTLVKAPAIDGREFGRQIVDTYRGYFANASSHELLEKAKAVTLSVIDLGKVAALDRAVAALATGNDAFLARGGHDAWVTLARAREHAEEYGRSGRLPPPPGSEVYDVLHVAETLKQGAAGKASGAAADAVIVATRAAIVVNSHGVGRPHANGVSIFYPSDKATLATRSKNFYFDNDFVREWSWYPFLRRYEDVPASDAERRRPKPAIDPLQASGRMVSEGSHVNITSQVHADDIADASFVVSMEKEGAQVIFGSIPVDLDAEGDLKEEWDGEWFTITDQHVELIAPITSFEELSDAGGDDVYWAGVPAQVRLHGTRGWIDVTLYFLLDFHGEDVSGDYIYAVEYGAHGAREIDLDAGDDLRPVYEVIDADGNEEPRVVDDPGHVIHLHDVDDLKVERSAVPPGNYQVGFVVNDLAGRRSDSFIDVEAR